MRASCDGSQCAHQHQHLACLVTDAATAKCVPSLGEKSPSGLLLFKLVAINGLWQLYTVGWMERGGGRNT